MAKHDNLYFKRLLMVNNQLRLKGINDVNVLNSMQVIPRHLFVSENLKDSAYDDTYLEIGYDQKIPEPYVTAFMIEALKLQPDSTILEVGTGSGYQAAVLSRICSRVYTIESVKELAINSKKLFRELGYTNIYSKIGNGLQGWPEKAPFDAIIISIIMDEMPMNLLEQLRVEGHMIFPYKQHADKEILLLITKTDNQGGYNRVIVRE